MLSGRPNHYESVTNEFYACFQPLDSHEMKEECFESIDLLRFCENLRCQKNNLVGTIKKIYCYIPLEKKSIEWILFYTPKIGVSATLKCATTHDFEVLIVSTTRIHRHIIPSHDARTPPTRTTKPSAPPAVQGRI